MQQHIEHYSDLGRSGFQGPLMWGWLGVFEQEVEIGGGWVVDGEGRERRGGVHVGER